MKIYRKTLVKQKGVMDNFIDSVKPYENLTNHEIFVRTNFSGFHSSLSEGLSSIDSLRNNDLVNIPLSDLNFLLRTLKQIKKAKIKIPKNYEEVFYNIYTKIADYIGQFDTPEARESKNEMLQIINNKNQAKEFYDLHLQLIPILMDLAFISYTFYVCAIITVQHSSLTRYPINGKTPDEIYTDQLPLVKKQREFMNLLEEALCRIHKIIT